MQRGYVKVWRKIEDSGLIQLPNTLALFMHLLLNATHKTRKVGTPTGVIELQRGQYISGRIELAGRLKQTEQQIRTSLKRLEELEIITIKSTNKFSVYTIENYSKYQDEQLADNQQNNQQETNKQPTDNQQTTTKQELKHLNIEALNKRTKQKADAFVLPDWINKTHWDAWHSCSKRKNATNAQKYLAVKKLSEWKDIGIDYGLALENAALAGWQGLFEPKANNQSTGNKLLQRDQSLAEYNRSTRESAKAKLFGTTTEKEVFSEAN